MIIYLLDSGIRKNVAIIFRKKRESIRSLQLVKKVRVSESAIQNEQHPRVTDACTKGSENEHSHKSVKFSDMCGEFDSLPPSPLA